MKQIDQIIVLRDPISNEGQKDVRQLDLSEVVEYGETFFTPGFEADVYLTDNLCYHFIKVKEGLWASSIEVKDGPHYTFHEQKYEGTFAQALDQLLTE